VVPIREKKHRLPAEAYKGTVAVAFTACIRNKAKAFVEAGIVKSCVESLLDAARRTSCDVIVYVFMPDHCHVVFQGRDDEANPLAAMKSFKQHTGFWFSKEHPEFRWQKDFYDHVLRSQQDVAKQVKYVLENPVRKGIVQDWKEYPFRGSTVHRLDDW